MKLIQAATTSHLPEADGIRGLACLIVLVVHATAVTFPATYPYLRGTAKVGVWLFFVLSAFLLTYKLLHRGFSLRTLVDYGLGRFLRIYPLFALTVLGYYLLWPSAGIATQADLVQALTLQKGYIHLWTVPVEFKFYFFLPGLLACASRSPGPKKRGRPGISWSSREDTLFSPGQLPWPAGMTMKGRIMSFSSWERM